MSRNEIALESVTMIRENLDDIPDHTFGPGYSIRWYQPGDEKLWLEIQSRADVYAKVNADLFKKEFGSDVETLSKRQCFLNDGTSKTIGTASAWFGHLAGRPLGRIHWIAIRPEEQGKGLAKPLLATVCNRLRSLGHSRVYLTTQTVRLPAINLYAKFGFTPVIDSEADRQIWTRLQRQIKCPLHL
ncbi:MAG: GNAT family N-acetyltransferase [Phycisphaerales bacterium]|nr:MAG: GNAT family N-acetyltransferase [Phycisphaerales bacterium]